MIFVCLKIINYSYYSTKFYFLILADNLILNLNSFQSSPSREMNSLCQLLLNIALEDPGIPNPKKCLTNLGQKLSEIDITEHTFSEVLRLYIRERNGFDDKVKNESLLNVFIRILFSTSRSHKVCQIHHFNRYQLMKNLKF